MTTAAATALTHTWYLTGRRLHAVLRQPAVIVISLVQPAIWLFLFGQLFRKVVDIPGFGHGGSYLDYLIPGIVAMNAMSSNMWVGMGTLEEIERGTLGRFLVSPASRGTVAQAAGSPASGRSGVAAAVSGRTSTPNASATTTCRSGTRTQYGSSSCGSLATSTPSSPAR